MKTKELRLLNEPDLENKAAELRRELMTINAQIAIGMLPKSPLKAREIKKVIAKIITIKRENQLRGSK